MVLPDWMISFSVSLPTASYAVVIGLLVNLERKVARLEQKVDDLAQGIPPWPKRDENT